MKITDHPAFLTRLNPPANIPGLRHYNPALCEYQGRTLVVWRVENEHGISRLAIAEYLLDGLTSGQWLDIECEAHAQIEDPRLCVVGNDIWLNWCLIADSKPPRMCFAKLRQTGKKTKTWKVGEVFQPDVFGNGRVPAKNWIMFDDEDSLPEDMRLAFFNGPSFGSAANMPSGLIIESSAITHPLGTVSGRSQAVRIGSELLAIVGGWRAHPRRRKQYWFAAMTWHVATLKPLRFSAKPLAWASEDDDYITCPRDADYNPLCLFPCGLVHKGGECTISLGVNDSWMALMRFSYTDLNLVPLSEIDDVRPLVSGEAPPPDMVRVKVISRQPLGENGFTYFPGEVFEVPKNRYAALCGHVVLA